VCQRGYQKLAVISAIGTRDYYRKRGFVDGKLYQVINT
jgi:elongator complex protein 3